jgi:hypothetical protein
VTESANVELVRSVCEPWGRGDFTASDWADAEIEFVDVGGPATGSRAGLDGMSRATGEWLNAWAEMRQQALEYRELPDGRVLVLFEFTARGRRSGLELGQLRTEQAGLFTVRDGLVTRLVHYFDSRVALAELGLER